MKINAASTKEVTITLSMNEARMLMQVMYNFVLFESNNILIKKRTTLFAKHFLKLTESLVVIEK